MFYLLQQNFNVEARGWVGAIVAIILGLGVVITTISLWVKFWREIGRPAWTRILDSRTLKRELALAHFERRWLLDHSDKPVFIMDEKQQIVFVNDAMCRTLHVDSSDIEGRAWHKLIRETELSRTLAKWEEAYKHHSPYVNVSQLMVGRKIVRFTVAAEPFVWNNKVRAYLGTIEPFDFENGVGVDPKLLAE